MLQITQLLGFLATAVLITAAPGPDNLMVLAVGMSNGRKQGVAFGLGCAAGCLTHTILAAIGVSTIIAASPMAFLSLKILGGLYLIYLGVLSWRAGASKVAAHTGDDTARKLFAKGLLANSINPKVVLFFLSFLPQFINFGRGNIAWQTVQLGIAFAFQAAVLFGLLGYFSGAIGQWFSARPKAGLWLNRTSGVVFIGIALRLMIPSW